MYFIATVTVKYLEKSKVYREIVVIIDFRPEGIPWPPPSEGRSLINQENSVIKEKGLKSREKNSIKNLTQKEQPRIAFFVVTEGWKKNRWWGKLEKTIALMKLGRFWTIVEELLKSNI